MNKLMSRREALEFFGYAGVGALVGSRIILKPQREIRVAGKPVDIVVSPVSEHTVRISVIPLENGKQQPIQYDGSLVQQTFGTPRVFPRLLVQTESIRCDNTIVKISPDPLTIQIEADNDRLVQQLRIDQQTGSFAFLIGEVPLLGLGEGGPQFDRRGSIDRMRSGQGGYRLQTYGGRVPIPWLIGTDGWALFVHQPFGTFDFTGKEGRFIPESPETALPLDTFIITAREPSQIMMEYARLTGYPEIPPLWALGYQQSHRTLADREEVISIARTFREKNLPCDVLIYLGTGFCPSGWNIANGSFTFNPSVFPDPKEIIQELHRMNFRIVLHDVILARSLHGTVNDSYDPTHFIPEEVASYWNQHREVFALGVDGWWPDEGDPLNASSRLTRNRMHWEGPQLDRPNERPYALHRNGYAGMPHSFGRGMFTQLGKPSVHTFQSQ